MRVAFAAQGLADGQGGLRVYAAGLLGALLRIQPGIEPFAAGRRSIGAPAGAARLRRLPIPTRILHRASVLGGLRIDALLGRPDLLHSPDAAAPATRAPQVLTVHDLIPFRLPELLPGEPDAPAHAMYREAMRRSLPRAARLICVSETTRADLLDCFPDLDPERMVTIPYGTPSPPPGFAQPGPAAGRPARVLFMGRVEPRKDLDTAVAAVSRLRAGGVDANLEVHGAVTDRAAAARAAAHDWVHLGGETQDSWSAYRGAAALLYPSLYEGFGLPPFEAFAAGVPVVAAAAGSLPELLGGAALLCPPGDAEAFAGALAQAIAAPAPLIDAGRARAARYTWESAARQVVEVWRGLA